MAELAEKAGVSVATISLVISDHPRISPKTKDLVRKIMEELHYVPNSIARGLVNQSLRTIGVVMSLGPQQALRHPYVFEMLSGMESGLRAGGYQMLLHHWDVWNQSPRELVDLWEQKRVDGFLLQLTDPLRHHLDEWIKRQLPFVLIGDPGNDSPVDWVEADNRQAGELAWTSVRQAGFQNPGFVGIQGDGIHQVRYEGFLAAAEKEGCHPPVYWAQSSDSAQEIRRGTPTATDALVCGSHYLAVALNDGQKGILTFDNLPYMEFLTPSLSTVDIDVFSLGQRAAEGLVRKLHDSEYKLQEKLELSRFIFRESLIRK